MTWLQRSFVVTPCWAITSFETCNKIDWNLDVFLFCLRCYFLIFDFENYTVMLVREEKFCDSCRSRLINMLMRTIPCVLFSWCVVCILTAQNAHQDVTSLWSLPPTAHVVSLVLNISDLPPDSTWSYCATGSAPMAERLSVRLVHRSGIPCRTACGIRLLAETV